MGFGGISFFGEDEMGINLDIVGVYYECRGEELIVLDIIGGNNLDGFVS